MPELFSEGVDRLLNGIRPHGRQQKTTAWPPGLAQLGIGADARWANGETLHQWFTRVVNQYCNGDPQRIALDDNIAVFPILGWSFRRSTTTLTYANIQAIIVDSDLESYYLDGRKNGSYLRLDMDYRSLGDPFSHPLAHIHIGREPAPRFALDGGNAGNVVVDFLEFIYRNYKSAAWLEWAESLWRRHFLSVNDGNQGDPFRTIVDAFRNNNIQFLRDHQTTIQSIKSVLRVKKDEYFHYFAESADREILEYPLAR